jgi:outer membrane protein assembly factor BamB
LKEIRNLDEIFKKTLLAIQGSPTVSFLRLLEVPTMLRFTFLVLIGCSALIAAENQKLDWPVFRGNLAMTGTAVGEFPEKPEVLWTFKAKDAVEGAAAIVEGTVYFGSLDDHLYALELKTGKEIWKTKLGPIKASPAIKGNRIYVGDGEGKFHAVDRKSGKVVWVFETEGEIVGGATFAGETILVGSHDARLYCIDDKGKKIWDFTIEGPVNGTAAVMGDQTFVAGCDSILHVLDTKTGKELGSVDLGGQAAATAAVFGDSLYVGTMTNQVLGIDWKARRISWRFESEKRKFPFYASAAVNDELVVVGGRDKMFRAIDRKLGTEKWTFLTENRVDGSPIILGNRVIGGSQDGNLYFLDLQTGKETHRIELDSAVTASPSFSDGILIIGADKGTIYAIGKK